MSEYINRQDAIMLKSDMIEVLLKRMKEGYGTTVGEYNDMVFDKIRNMSTTTEAEICRKFAERLKEKSVYTETEEGWSAYTVDIETIDRVLAEMDKES